MLIVHRECHRCSFFLLINIHLFLCDTTLQPTVVTPLGEVEGYWAHSTNNRKYAAFEGVPYALPPVGEGRFQEPKPVKPWTGKWQAKNLYKCLQYNHYTEPREDFVIGDEDCLYLNIYTPRLNKSAKLDVIVFIHGGAFMFNSGGTYGPKHLMDRVVVFVALNYRLGPLGFLCTEDSSFPGNNGLRDQLLALKWIQQNIEYFGGNPNSITLTGMSAGGSSVHLHFLSPLSAGLFHRGIAQSGTALNPWVLVENSLWKARKLASVVGCDLISVEEMVECLKQRPGRQIVDAVKYFLPWLYNPFSPFGVVVDKWSESPVVPEHPFVLLKDKKVADLPIIFSNVQSEGLYPAADFIGNPKYLYEIEDRWDYLIPYILDFNNTVTRDRQQEVVRKIRDFYFGREKLSEATFPKLVKMITDRLFLVDIERAAKLHSSATGAPVRYYYFSYRGAHSKSELRTRNNKNYGASHGDDTVYVLSSNVDVRSTEIDAEMSELLLSLWISYANNSDPKLSDLIWTPMSKVESAPIVYVHIKSPSDINVETSSNLGNRHFWDTLPIEENQKLLQIKGNRKL